MGSLRNGRLTTTLLFCPAIALLVCLCSIGCRAENASGDSQEKPASPFYEPKPKIPEAMLSDKRLDQRVTVFVKSQNVKEFFRSLTDKTGVKIGASHDIWGERPIVLFHDRPLRDVLTEISGLYGYYWLAKGEEGKWSYELFEDIRHAQKRKRVSQEHKDDMEARLLETIEIGRAALKSPAELEKLRNDEELYKCITQPDEKAFLELLCMFDTSAIRAWLAGEKWAETFEKLPSDKQEAMRTFVNAYARQNWLHGQEHGQSGTEPQPWTLDEMSKVVVSFKTMSGLRDLYPPHIVIRMGDPRKIRNNGTLANARWPSWDWGTENWRLDLPPTEMVGDPLPEDEKITLLARKYWFGDSLLVGDVLEAIARQSGMDVIADHYLQDWWFEELKDAPLDQVVRDVCTYLDYACQVEKNTLRFRYVRWFESPAMTEPPAELLAGWWKEIEEDGTLTFDDILDIASLPDDQLFWPGLKLLPGAEMAWRATTTLRMWNALSDAFKLEGTEHAIVPVAQMTGKQQEAIYEWVKVIGSDPSLVELTNSVVEFYLKTDTLTTGSDVDTYTVDIIFPDGNKRSMGVGLHNLYPALTKEQRAQVIKERRADAESDEVRVM